MSNAIGVNSTIALPNGFEFNEVRHINLPEIAALATVPAPVAPPSLGPLADFKGNWTGSGFNTIFRPHKPSQTSPTDNVLELNLTSESLSFSGALGSVPNRGEVQEDIFLNGVSYLQAINDVTDPKNTVGIHVEPGLWMAVQPTTNPAEGSTVVRMASIPHGTTVQAQGTARTFAGPPTIPVADITPFANVGGGQVKFPSQTAANQNTPRIPQDLSSFLAAGTITQAMLTDPNTVLRNHLQGQKVISTTEITIHTNPAVAPTAAANPTLGGGTNNIAFLVGSAAPNANATQLTATFWIETVEHTISLPIFHPGQPPIVVPQPVGPGPVRPVLSVVPAVPVTAPRLFTFTTKQIQYSQTVMLSFKELTWPHVSVATLVPGSPVTVHA